MKFDSKSFAKNMYNAIHGDGSDKRQPVDIVLVGVVIALIVLCF